MAFLSPHGYLLLLEIIVLPSSLSSNLKNLEETLNPSPFPANFLFGTASSSYQFEGAYLSDGKGLNNWDIYTHKPGKIIDVSNGDVAVDQYHRYQEDIDLMVSLGINSYRFSISWARILPRGRFGNANLAGIGYYNNLINALLLKGIQPFVTLTHFDVPQELEDRYGGFLSSESQKDFGHYADICFKYFGDSGNSEEPFVVAHNIILSHAIAIDIYRSKYQKKQGGSVGIVMHCAWFEPISHSIADKLVSERAQAFFMSWFLDPIITGRYPAEMIQILGPILPEFMDSDKEKLKKGIDFIGINHYTSSYVQDCISSLCDNGPGSSKTEGFCRQSQQKNGVPIGKPTDLELLYIYPQGMENIVTYLKDRYNNMPMFITENGYGDVYNPNLSFEESLNDKQRVEYLSIYLDALSTAIRKGADVRGYFVWSLLDNFEWTQGYRQRFGLYHVDHVTLKRTPKLSAAWFKEFITKNKISKANI